MSWQQIVKAIPPKEELEGWLMTPAGVNRIASQFEDALESGETKNLRGSKKQIEDFAEGKTTGLTPEIAAKVQEHAKKVQVLLNEMFESKQLNSRGIGGGGGTKVTDKLLQEALDKYKEGDKESLIDWLGENNRNRHTQKRQKVLRENREAIRNLPRDDDLFYYTFDKPGENTVYTTEPDADLQEIRDAFSGIDGISFREDLKDELDDEDKPLDNNFNKLPGVSIIPPKKMSLSEYKKFAEVLEKLRADKATIYKRKGQVLPSVMLSVVGDVEEIELNPEERRAKGKFEGKGSAVKFKGNVTESKQVLTYFELLTRKGWANKIKFMPDSILSQNRNSLAMKELIGQGTSSGWSNRLSLNPSLETILNSPTFDLSSMLEVGMKETREISYTLRNLISTDTNNDATQTILDDAQVTQSELNDLRVKAQKTGGGKYIDWPRFQRNLKSKDASGLNEVFTKLVRSMEGPTQNLFNPKEIEFFKKLVGKSEEEVEDAIADFYNVDIDTVMESEVTIPTRRILNKENMFISVGNLFKLSEEHSHKDRETFTRVFRAFRKEKYSEDISMDTISDSSLTTLKNTLTENFNPNKDQYKDGTNSASIIDYIITIDFYYRRGLIEEVNKYYDERQEEGGEAALKKLLQSIQQDYTEIIQSLVKATNHKMEDIIANREDYIKAMKFKVKRDKNRTYAVLKTLKDAGLVIAIGDDDNE